MPNNYGLKIHKLGTIPVQNFPNLTFPNSICPLLNSIPLLTSSNFSKLSATCPTLLNSPNMKTNSAYW